MDWTGITWLDVTMAVLTIVGFPATGYGVYQAWSQAKRATSAADEARKAIAATRSQLATHDLMNELRSIRSAIHDVQGSTDRNESEIAQFTLIRLADSMRRAATLARDHGTPKTDGEVLTLLDTLSRDASAAKADLARRPSVKVRTVTADLVARLTDLSHLLLEIETSQQYVITEDS